MKTPAIIGTLAATAAFATTGGAMDFQTDTFKTKEGKAVVITAIKHASLLLLDRRTAKGALRPLRREVAGAERQTVLSRRDDGGEHGLGSREGAASGFCRLL